MHSIKANFDKILGLLKEVLGDNFSMCGNYLRPGPKPKFTDIEVIALSLTAEILSIDSELLLFHKLQAEYQCDFPNLLSRRQFNDRRKSLREQIKDIQKMMSDKINVDVTKYVVDSMPLEICKLSRKDRNRMAKDSDSIKPQRGYCSAQSKYYYGFKLHAICSTFGVFAGFEIGQAKAHDVKFLEHVPKYLKNCTLLGDKGYLSTSLKEKLYLDAKIDLITPSRKNQKTQNILPSGFGANRKRIETVFSQLADIFMIQRNYTKSLIGFVTRLISKICGMTVLHFRNKFITHRPLGQIKYSLKN